MTEAVERLKGCPFCGGEAVAVVGDGLGGTYHLVWCEGCDTESPEFQSPQEAFAAWNRRTKPAEGEPVAWREALEKGRDYAEQMPDVLRANGLNVFADYLTDFVNLADRTLTRPVAWPDREAVDWAVTRWNDEVWHRPVQNKNRRTLDDTWRQVIRHFGGNPDTLLALPPHDALLSASDGAGQVEEKGE